jgi:hypothetical protein
MHLTPGAFVDVIDGTTPESKVPHLAVCPACRDQLTRLRRTAAQVERTEVPEPSPLFWDHLSARVREAVAAESVSAPWWAGGGWRFVAVAATALAALAIVVAPRMVHPQRQPLAAQDQVLAPSRPVNEAAGDDSLAFVSDLAAGVDWEAADAAGLVERGSAELALAQMDPAERLELQRLLNDALTSASARGRGAPGI